MSSPFTSKLLRCLFLSQDQNADVKQIAIKTAHQCVDGIVERLIQNPETLSPVQLKGYLRAVAIPMIDAAISKTLFQHRRLGRAAAEIRTLTLETLEQLVLEKLEKPPIAVHTKAAA